MRAFGVEAGRVEVEVHVREVGEVLHAHFGALHRDLRRLEDERAVDLHGCLGEHVLGEKHRLWELRTPLPIHTTRAKERRWWLAV